LRHYYAGKSRVQFCQCFVFSAVMTAAGRALGLPTRSITNFQSAADHNINNAVDKYYEEDDKGYFRPAKKHPHDDDPDSVWNFHVWNEGWMARPAIDGINVSGWQAFDGTPQVQSDGKYRVGPAPVIGILRNRITMPYDTKFVVSEVNANIAHYVKDKKTNKFVLKNTYVEDPYDKSATPGQKVSTKKPGVLTNDEVRRIWAKEPSGESWRLDVTALYKKPEPSGPEPPFRKRNIGDVEAKLIFPRGKRTQRGERVNFGYVFYNNIDRPISLHVYYKITAVDYAQDVLFKIGTERKIIEIEPMSEFRMVEYVEASDYERLFTEDGENSNAEGYLNFILSAKVDHDNTLFYHEKSLIIHDDNNENAR